MRWGHGAEVRDGARHALVYTSPLLGQIARAAIVWGVVFEFGIIWRIVVFDRSGEYGILREEGKRNEVLHQLQPAAHPGAHAQADGAAVEQHVQSRRV